MDDLPFYIFFNRSSVISGWWVDDNEKLCAMETSFTVEMISPRAGLELTNARSGGQCLTHWAAGTPTKNLDKLVYSTGGQYCLLSSFWVNMFLVPANSFIQEICPTSFKQIHLLILTWYLYSEQLFLKYQHKVIYYIKSKSMLNRTGSTHFVSISINNFFSGNLMSKKAKQYVEQKIQENSCWYTEGYIRYIEGYIIQSSIQDQISSDFQASSLI